MDGFVVVDKPGGMTSHDVVSQMRRLARLRRVGHGGTLDPMATGVLVVATGRATRMLRFVSDATKGYAATVRLGQRTVTDDAEGEVVTAADAAPVTEPAVVTGLAALTGEIAQVPSAVSAIKVDGQRAYRRVREGEQVALAARQVTVSRLDLQAVRRPAPELLDVDIDLACSSGTYVRAIARDLGEALGVGGHLTALRRTFVGGFTLAEAVSLDELSGRAPDVVTLSLAQAARRMFPHRDVDVDQARALSHGGTLAPAGSPADLTGPYAVFDPDGEVVAVVTERDGRARPDVVLRPAG